MNNSFDTSTKVSTNFRAAIAGFQGAPPFGPRRAAGGPSESPPGGPPEASKQ